MTTQTSGSGGSLAVDYMMPYLCSAFTCDAPIEKIDYDLGTFPP